MSRRTLNTNIAGRVKKVTTADVLVPIYEAICNSIQAIDAAGHPGRIDVQILRQARQGEIAGATLDGQTPVTGFVISDNGIGFDEQNMGSFCEADSELKAKIGGKGVGRFSWLKFFEKATVESVYQLGAERRFRRFSFSTLGVDEEPPVAVNAELMTEVRLSPLRVSWEGKARRSLDEITVGIIEHFIAYFVTGAMPKLVVTDGAATRDLGEVYRSSIGKAASESKFEIKGRTFSATCLKFYLSNQVHAVFLCGDKRVGEKVPLGRCDPFFKARFQDDDLKTYAFHVFVQSDYLDEIVHDDRDGFRFPEPGTLDFRNPEAIARDEIVERVLQLAHEEMAAEIEQMKTRNVETVKAFAASEAPQYRSIIARNPDAVANIHDSDKTRIDQALRRLQFEEEMQTRSEVGVLLKQAEQKGAAEKPEWEKKVSEVLTKVSEEGKATLAAYIVQRKLILELLGKRMEVKADGKRSLEEAVHSLIFPMRTTSDEVSYEDQNLWIIDERLSYHHYLASDKPLKTIEPAESDSRKEPDVIVFNRPIALNDRPENERLESIVILEFKRPGESGLDGDRTPVTQIQEYIELIQSGKANNRKGRQILATQSTYFFGYVICDLPESLKKVLKRSTMRETPDGRGMFGYFEDHRAYIEVLTYEKVLDDAQKRNRILFDKLRIL
jgi:hypothetical protein